MVGLVAADVAVPVSPDLDAFARDLARGLSRAVDQAGDVTVTVTVDQAELHRNLQKVVDRVARATAVELAAQVDAQALARDLSRAADRAADAASPDLDVDVDEADLIREMARASETAAARAPPTLDVDVDDADLARDLSAAAERAARAAAVDLDTGIDEQGLSREVVEAARRAVAQAEAATDLTLDVDDGSLAAEVRTATARAVAGADLELTPDVDDGRFIGEVSDAARRAAAAAERYTTLDAGVDEADLLRDLTSAAQRAVRANRLDLEADVDDADLARDLLTATERAMTAAEARAVLDVEVDDGRLLRDLSGASERAARAAAVELATTVDATALARDMTRAAERAADAAERQAVLDVGVDAAGLAREVGTAAARAVAAADVELTPEVDDAALARDMGQATARAMAQAEGQATLDVDVDDVGLARDMAAAATRAVQGADVDLDVGVDEADLARRVVAAARTAAAQVEGQQQLAFGVDDDALVRELRGDAARAAAQVEGQLTFDPEIDRADLTAEMRRAVETAEAAAGRIEIDAHVDTSAIGPGMIAAADTASRTAGLRIQSNFRDAARAAAASFTAAGGDFRALSQDMEAAGQRMSRAITLPLIAIGGLSVKAAVDFETAFAGVRKTVDATEDQFAELETGIREMALSLPATRQEIALVGEAAGQLGIRREAILGFTRTMIDLGESTNMTADQAATAMARIANIMQTPQSEFDRLGSTVVDLGNNLATTEGEIVEMSLRIASAGRQVGLTEAEVLSFAGALSSVGINAEAGGSAISRVFIELQNAVMDGGDALDIFAETAGVSASEFATAFGQDAAGATILFMEGLRRVQDEGGNTNTILQELGLADIRVGNALRSAAGAGDLFRESMELGNVAWAENTALTEESAQRYETTASQLEMLRNQVTDIGVTLGDALVPALLEVVDLLEPVINGFARAAEVFAALPDPVQRFVLILGTIAAAAGPVLWAIGSLAEGASIVATGIGSMATAFRLAAPTISGYTTVATGATAATSTLTIAIARLLGPIGLIAGAAFAVDKALDALDGAFGRTSGSAENFAEDLANLAASGQVAGELEAAFGSSIDGIIGQLERLDRRDWLTTVNDSFRYVGMSSRDLDYATERIGNLDTALAEMVTGGAVVEAVGAFDRIKEAAVEQGLTIDELRARFPEYVAALEVAAEQEGLVASAADDAAGSMAAMGEDAGEAVAPVEELTEVQQELVDALAGFATGPVTAYQEILAEKQAAEQESAQATADATEDSSDSWEDYAKDVGVSLGEVTKALQEQTKDALAWQENLVVVAERGGYALAAELAAMGPEAAGMVADLTEATDEEFQAFAAAMSDNAAAAGEGAAQALDQKLLLMSRYADANGTATVQSLATSLEMAPEEVRRIADEMGLELAEGMTAGKTEAELIAMGVPASVAAAMGSGTEAVATASGQVGDAMTGGVVAGADASAEALTGIDPASTVARDALAGVEGSASGVGGTFDDVAEQGTTALGRLWDSVAQWGSGVWDGIKSGAADAATWVSDRWSEATTWVTESWAGLQTRASEAWTGVTTAVSGTWDALRTRAGEVWTGITEAVAGAAETVRTRISTAWDGLTAWASSVWTGVTTAVSDAWNGVAEAVGARVDAIRQAIAGPLDLISDAFRVAWFWIERLLSEAWTRITTAAQTALGDLAAKFRGAVDPLVEWWRGVWERFPQVLSEAWTTIRTTVTTALSSLFGGMQSQGNGLAEWWSGLWTRVSDTVRQWTSTVTQTIAGWLEPLTQRIRTAWQAVSDFIGQVWAAISGTVSRWTSTITGVLQGWLDAVSQRWNAVWTTISNFANTIWTAISGTVSRWTSTIMSALQSWLAAVSERWNAVWTAISDFATRIWTAISSTVSRWTSTIMSTVQGWLSAVSDLWTRVWDAISRKASDIWTAISSTVSTWMERVRSTVDSVTSTISGIWTRFTDGLSSTWTTLWSNVQSRFLTVKGIIERAFETMASAIGRAWAAIKEAVAAPVRYVVNTVYNNGIRKFWNIAANELPGVNPLPTVSLGFQTGGEVPGVGRGDRVPALLEPREYVVQRKVVERVERIAPGTMDALNAGDLTVLAQTAVPPEPPRLSQGEYRALQQGAQAAGNAAALLARPPVSATAEPVASPRRAEEGVPPQRLPFSTGGLVEAFRSAGVRGYQTGGSVTGDLQGLNPSFLTALRHYSAGISRALRVVSGYRSIAEQQVLYNRWINRVPGQAQAARPGSSMHNYGLAADLSPQLGNTALGNPAAGKYGLRYPMSFEPWHIEPVNARQMRDSGGGVVALFTKVIAAFRTFVANAKQWLSGAPGERGVGDLVRGMIGKLRDGVVAKITDLIPGLRVGGLVPGSGRGDRVPILAEPGEYVMQRTAVEALGVETLDALNEGTGAPAAEQAAAAMQDGGVVEWARRDGQARGGDGAALRVDVLRVTTPQVTIAGTPAAEDVGVDRDRFARLLDALQPDQPADDPLPAGDMRTPPPWAQRLQPGEATPADVIGGLRPTSAGEVRTDRAAAATVDLPTLVDALRDAQLGNQTVVNAEVHPVNYDDFMRQIQTKQRLRRLHGSFRSQDL